MKNFIEEDNTLFLTHKGYKRIQQKLKDGSTTLLEMLQRRAERQANRKFLGAINKNFEVDYMTFGDLNKSSMKLSKYLSSISTPYEIIGIASANRPEWMIAEYATYYSNCVNSPLFTTFREEALSYIISITKMRILIAAPSFIELVLERVYGYISSDLIKLEFIVLMEENKAVSDLCTKRGLTVVSLPSILFGEAENGYYLNNGITICERITKYFLNNLNGDSLETEINARGLPESNDLATVCFTSGTTGVPKGVELTHSNFISQVEGFEIGSEDYDILKVASDTVYFSCLPLSHVFERIVVCSAFSVCAKICFFRGDKTKIGEDLKTAEPTFIAAVPKILQAFHQKIEEEVSKKKFYERFVYRAALKLKIFLQHFNIYSVGFLDQTIFKKVAKGFGGKINAILCGGAAIDPYLIKYMQAVLGAFIFQGYGQTEGLGANSLATTSLNDCSSIGIPFPTTKFKLVSVDPSTSSPEKAMFLKGYSITRGYYKASPEILKRLLDTGKFSFKIENINESPFDEDGWLITGDVVIYKNRKLYIVGRSKDLVKLDNGEYISCENIENKLRETDFIKDVFISKIQSCDKFVALVSVISKDITNFEVASYLRKSLNVLIAKKTIPRCVEISKFAVIRTSFAEVDDGILFTPTLKKKRFIFTQKFEKELINSVYIDDILSETKKLD